MDNQSSSVPPINPPGGQPPTSDPKPEAPMTPPASTSTPPPAGAGTTPPPQGPELPPPPPSVSQGKKGPNIILFVALGIILLIIAAIIFSYQSFMGSMTAPTPTPGAQTTIMPTEVPTEEVSPTAEATSAAQVETTPGVTNAMTSGTPVSPTQAPVMSQ